MTPVPPNEGMWPMGLAGTALLVRIDGLTVSERLALMAGSSRTTIGLLKMRFGYCWLLDIRGVATFDAPFCPMLLGQDREFPGSRDPVPSADWGLALTLSFFDGNRPLRSRVIGTSNRMMMTAKRYHEAALAEPGFSPEAWEASRRNFELRYSTPQAALRDALTYVAGERSAP